MRTRIPGLGGLSALGDVCSAGRAASTSDPGGVLYQTYFGTDARRAAFIAQCGSIDLSPVIPPPTGGRVVETPPFTAPCPPGYVLLGGQCVQIGGDLGPPVGTPPPPKPSAGGSGPSPTCIGANYTVIDGQCVYPLGGPSTHDAPPLVLPTPAPNTPSSFQLMPPIASSCPGGLTPDAFGVCPPPAAPTPSAWQTIEGYLKNPWVLGGGAVVIYLATRKKTRARRRVAA